MASNRASLCGSDKGEPVAEDWIGNSKSVSATLGASNHSEGERQAEDYYATHPDAGKILLAQENFNAPIWECACGEGHLAKVFKKAGHKVVCTDLIQRGCAFKELDFLKYEGKEQDVHIITNPPYKFAEEFIRKALDVVADGNKVCMFLKLQFLEGQGRKPLFVDYPPARLYVSSSRIPCAMNGDFKAMKSSAVAYGWYVWVKGVKQPTQIHWVN
jgi:hypothetical protein